MSLYGAIMTGISGLNAQSQALSVTSANIANVNTIGYKDGENQFATLVTGQPGPGDIAGAGVIAITGQNVAQQGLLQTTTTSTNLGLSGNGMFIVDQQPGDTSNLYYTRAGDFTPDANGNLVNSSGFYLMGWQLDANGNIPADRSDLTNINLSNLDGKAEATTNITLAANLQSSTPANSYSPPDPSNTTATPSTAMPDFQRTINVYDSQGGSQPVTVSYYKGTQPNTWNYEISYQGAPGNLDSNRSAVLSAGTVTFDSNGNMTSVASSYPAASSPTTGTISFTIPFTGGGTGLSDQTINLNMGTPNSSTGLSQFDSASTLTSSNVDGALFGSLSSVSVDKDGYVVANFSNGLSQKVYKVPVATFDNPDGLSAISGNAYSASVDSGTPVVQEANTGGAGQIQSDSLETSTVDLATEFTNLITTQRAYSASARIVTTADQMLQSLEQLQ
ncbi:MAG TPA: flagellar hook protein FlgE [Rhizomicrobium sp.]|jgi:flagellar hook protein FlgE